MSAAPLDLGHPRVRRPGASVRAGRRALRVEVHAERPTGESLRRVIEAMRRARAMLDAGRTEAEECLGVALDRLIERARSEVESSKHPPARPAPPAPPAPRRARP